MDQGEPGKDLLILEQMREADPHETESSKKMEAATERYAHGHYWDGQHPIWGYSPRGTAGAVFPLRGCVPPPPAELPKVIFFFADLDCGFSSKYVVIFLEKEVCGD